jgi:hypothetical protein
MLVGPFTLLLPAVQAAELPPFQNSWPDASSNGSFPPIAAAGGFDHNLGVGLNDSHGEPVLRGTWLYDGRKRETITIVARSYDMRFSTFAADGMLEDGEQPVPLGPDGRLYYVAASPPLRSLEEAKEWADSQPWGPVEWDNS